jgi:sec-independent protein translocase protein TatC
LEELRKRLIYSFVGIGVAFALSYAYIKEIVEILMRPLVKTLPPGSSLVFTAVPEAFFTYFKAALLAGVFFSSPFILYQVWAFVSPGLYQREKKYVLPYLFVSTFFFVLGAGFCYFIVFPTVFRFFLSFATDSIRPMPSIREYLTFTIKLLLAFGLLFQWPALVLFLSRMGVVTSPFLSRNRKYAILLIFVAAAVLTPPDLVSQLLLAGPLIVMYEGSIWMAKIFGWKDKKDQAGEQEEGKKESSSEAKSD